MYDLPFGCRGAREAVKKEAGMRILKISPLLAGAALGACLVLAAGRSAAAVEIRSYPVPPGAHPHDVAPAPDGGVWYTAQHQGALGRLDPATGKTEHIPLGEGSRPHGVIVGPDGAPWITDGGLNAIVRVDPRTREVRRFPLPASAGYANLNTAAFGGRGVLWFTGQSGVYGSLDPRTGALKVYKAPRGRGPYGIATAPDGAVYYASLAGSHIARIDARTGAAAMILPPTPDQGSPARLGGLEGADLGERVEQRKCEPLRSRGEKPGAPGGCRGGGPGPTPSTWTRRIWSGSRTSAGTRWCDSTRRRSGSRCSRARGAGRGCGSCSAGPGRFGRRNPVRTLWWCTASSEKGRRNPRRSFCPRRLYGIYPVLSFEIP